MKILITHTDMDGYGGNILEKLYHDKLDFDSVYNMNYGLADTDEAKALMIPDNEIIMMDLSIPEKDFIEWKRILRDFHVYDHHSSSEYLSKYEGNVWNTSLCGTGLFWKYYVEPRVSGLVESYILENTQKLVTIIDTYDRWQEDSPLWDTAKKLMKVNMGYGKNFTDHMIDKILHSTPDRWTSKELDIIKEKEETENNILSDLEKDLQIRTDNSGHTFTIVPIEYTPAVSVCCSEFLKKHEEIDYMIVYNRWKKKMSWRTRKDIDLTNIHGVSGHQKAAGSEGGRFIDSLVTYGCCPRWVINERKSATPIIEKCRNISVDISKIF